MSPPGMPPIDMNPHDWAIVSDILMRLVPHYEVWAFGSRVRWTAKEYSDLDLVVVTDKALEWSTRTALAEAFDESDLLIKVDVVDWATTSVSFRQIIQSEKVLVQEKTDVHVVPPA